MKKTVLFLLTLFAICVARKRGERPKTYLDVTTDLGTYGGESILSNSGELYYKFRGIRYALPPSYYNRFDDAPAYNISWIGNKPVFEYEANCVGYDNLHYRSDYAGDRSYLTTGEEDCLFLNVHTRSLEKKVPVIFFIHGGGFGFGGPSQFGSNYIMDREVVYVNIAYRLGPLGFLSTGDHVVRGNMGLKDQLLALQWVNKYIGLFGGDKNKITITGVSAGGASAHFLYLSPLTTGLFQKVFTHSGTALCPWALFQDIPQKTRQLARYLSCPDSPSEKMVACLRIINPKRLVASVAHFKVFLFNPFTIFGPVVDSGFENSIIPQHPKRLMNSPSNKALPFVTGVTAEDGLYSAAEYILNVDQMKRVLHYWDTFLPEILFYKKECYNKAHYLKKVLLQHRKEYGRSFAASLLSMITDHLYIVPAILSTQLMASHNNYSPVRLYYFRYRGAATTSDIFLNQGDNAYPLVGHADDCGYIYNMPGMNLRNNPRDRLMSSEMIDLIVTFAEKTTLPFAFRSWESVGPNMFNSNRSHSVKYMDIAGPKNYTAREQGSIFIEIIQDTLWNCHS